MPSPTVSILIRGLTTAERDQLREIAWKARTSVAVLLREMIRTKLHAVNRAAAAKPAKGGRACPPPASSK